MVILYGTQANGVQIPIALFDISERLSNYVNQLNPFGILDISIKAKSLLADCVDWQATTVDQIFDTRDDWASELAKVKNCPRNPEL